jgi:hypothetical protein
MKDNEISLLMARRPNALAFRFNMNTRRSGCSATVYLTFYKALSTFPREGDETQINPDKLE